MLNITNLNKMIVDVERIEEIKHSLEFIMYEHNISSSDNNIYINKNDHTLASRYYYKNNEYMFFEEINKIIILIKNTLNKLKENNELNVHNAIYYWKHGDEYFKSNNKYKIYYYILFDENYIYKLFGDEYYYISNHNCIDIKKTIDDLMENSEIYVTKIEIKEI